VVGQIAVISMDARSMIMTYRPMSQMLRLFVVPEIEKRVAAGTLPADQLPFQVHQFRFLQGDGQNVIEINDDVKIAAKVSVIRPMKAGEPVALADINPDECFLEPPTINGKPAGFFLCRSLFLNFITMFDFTPGAPPEPPRARASLSWMHPLLTPFTGYRRSRRTLLPATSCSIRCVRSHRTPVRWAYGIFK
jgi:hypothetical protein